MRLSILTGVTLMSLTGVLSAEVPREINVLMHQREKAIKKTNETAAKELIKLKATYMKRGDLAAANKAVEVRKKLTVGKIDSFTESNDFLKDVVGKKWAWRHRADKKSWFILKADGSAQVSWYRGPKARWRRVEDRTIAIFFPKGQQTAILSWAADLKSYSGYERDFSLKLSGKKIK